MGYTYDKNSLRYNLIKDSLMLTNEITNDLFPILGKIVKYHIIS